MNKSKLDFIDGKILTPSLIEIAINVVVNDKLIHMHKEIIDKYYSKRKLTDSEKLRKRDIEFMLLYLEADDIYETLQDKKR